MNYVDINIHGHVFGGHLPSCLLSKCSRPGFLSPSVNTFNFIRSHNLFPSVACCLSFRLELMRITVAMHRNQCLELLD